MDRKRSISHIDPYRSILCSRAIICESGPKDDECHYIIASGFWKYKIAMGCSKYHVQKVRTRACPDDCFAVSPMPIPQQFIFWHRQSRRIYNKDRSIVTHNEIRSSLESS